jgi:uncharacterized SAM-binding protein YcdF (DUF218 family)
MYSFLVKLCQPDTLLFLLACWALFRLWRRRADPRRRWWPLLVPVAGLVLLCTPLAAHLALLPLESYSTPLEDRPPEAEAIIVFSSGVYPPEGPRPRPEMDEDTLHRCLEAARLYARGPGCPVVVSGGKVDPDTPGPSAAAVMASFLEQHGVKAADLLPEENSRTTFENAAECAKLLKAKEIRRVVLVVDAVDMWRAASCLRKQGIEVVPAPCHFRATRFRPSLFAILPSPEAANRFRRVWHECLGIVWYWCRGRI